MIRKTIIWDWNGTLLNDLRLCVAIANDLIRPHTNRKLSLEKYLDVFGFPVTDYYARIGIDFEKESFESLAKRFIAGYSAEVKNCLLHDKTRETLQLFNEKGFHQYILTAAHRDNVVDLLHHFSIRDYFRQVAGLDNHHASSKIDVGLQLIANNDIQKENAVLIGDTIHDFEVANKIGVNCILIANGHQSKERLNQGTPENVRVIDSMAELEKVPDLF